MNAIEIRRLSKSFRGIPAVQDLSLTVPQGSIYGFIGENGSGKSTTQKLVCGLLVPKGGEIRLFGKPHTNAAIRSNIGVLIENPGCFPSSTVYDNLMMQALNLGLGKPGKEVRRVLELVSMGGAAGRKFKECSLGMKQRLGVAQSLLGHPQLLILDEPINGLDADGMRIVRETLIGLNQQEGVSIMISSHILGELSKIATHYGIIRRGTLIRELPARAMSDECRDFVFVRTNDNNKAKFVLARVYREVEVKDGGVRVYDESESSHVSKSLYESGLAVSEVSFQKVGLEEYYLRTMSRESEGR
jgi:ABC-2 type transport system ATP-binding protein